MFIAMNRFRVVKGSEDAFENVWLSRDSHLDTVPGFVEFRLLKGPEAEDTHCMPPTPYGRTGPPSRPGPDPRPFGPLTRGPERISPSTSAIPNSRASRFARPSALARRRTSRLESRPSLYSRQIRAAIGQRMYFGDA
jgi:hypothetical protein